MKRHVAVLNSLAKANVRPFDLLTYVHIACRRLRHIGRCDLSSRWHESKKSRATLENDEEVAFNLLPAPKRVIKVLSVGRSVGSAQVDSGLGVVEDGKALAKPFSLFSTFYLSIRSCFE